uniref:FYVE, RhoGEF and PH domain-containing protein 5 n=1 Tax=Myxine glutinosa TaxID=7769 RepID=UPI00358DFCA2
MSMESQESRKELAPSSPPLRERKPKPPLAPKPPPPKRPPVAEVKPLRSQGYIMGRVSAETTERRGSEGREWKLLMRMSGKAELSRLEGPGTLAWRQSGSLFYLHSEAPRRASLSRVDAERCRHSEIDGGTWRAIDSNEGSYSERVKGTVREGPGRQEQQQGSCGIIGSANKNKTTQKGESLIKKHTVSVKDATKEEVFIEDLNASQGKAKGEETEAISSASKDATVTEGYELILREEQHLDSEVSNTGWSRVPEENILQLGHADQQMSKEEQETQRISHSQSLDDPSTFPVLADNASVKKQMSGETPGVEHYGGIVKGKYEVGQDNVPLLKDKQEEEQVAASHENFLLQGPSSENRKGFSQEEIPGQLIESESVLSTTCVGNSERNKNDLYQESPTEGVPLNQSDQQTVAIKSHKNGNKENCGNYLAVQDKEEDKFKEGNEENIPVLIETDHKENLKEGSMEKWMKTAIRSSEQSVQHDNNDNGEEEENYYEVDSVSSSVDEPSDGLYSEIYGVTTAPTDKVDELPRAKSLMGTPLLFKHGDDENQTSQDHIADGLVQGTPRTQSCGGRLTKERAAEQGGGQDSRPQAFMKPQLQSTPALYSQGRFQSRQGALVSPAERRRWPGLVPPSPLAISAEHGTTRGLAKTRTRGCLQHREWNRTTGPLLVRDIPPPFELATITRKPIAKSSPSILMEIEPLDKPSKQSPKKKSSLKRLLPFKISMKKKIDSSQLANELPYCLTKSPEMDRKSLGNSPRIKSKRAQRGKPASPLPTQHTYHGRQKTYKLICRVESFEAHQRPSHSILPLTKPRSISFPSPSSSSCTDYENVLPGSGDYENMTPPVRKSNRTKPSRYISGEKSGSATCGTDSDGYVDMSNFSNLEGKKGTEIDLKRYFTSGYGENSTVQAQSVEGTNQGTRRKELDNVDKESKLQEIAKEMVQSERSFVDSLKLLHVDFREAVEQASQR